MSDLFNSPQELYERVLDILEEQSAARALDELYDRIDDCLITRDFDRVKEFIGTVMTNSRPMPLVMLGGLLTITHLFREELGNSRKALAEFAFRYGSDIYGEERTSEILRGLI